MRPLSHPAAANITVEGILHALAEPARVDIFVQIATAGCSQNCSAFLKLRGRSMPKSTLSQHFKVLREAGLIRSERKGVELHNTLRRDELHERFGTLIAAIVDAHHAQCKRLQRAQRGKRAKPA